MIIRWLCFWWNKSNSTRELNIVDGTSATSTTVDADRVVLNDNGTMVQATVTDISTYRTLMLFSACYNKHKHSYTFCKNQFIKK